MQEEGLTMGDRGNIFVIDQYSEQDTAPDGPFAGTYLYTHWSGYELPSILAAALDSKAGRGRWNDGPYLTRIIFCRLIAGDVDGETGFGISCSICDNSYPILVVDPANQKVRMMKEGSERSRTVTNGLIASWTFEEFIAAAPDWPNE